MKFTKKEQVDGNKVCIAIILICVIAGLMNVIAYSIHSHKLNEIDECFYEYECEEVDIYGEMKEICYSTGCDYIKLHDEYNKWREKGVSSFVWRLLD